MVPLLRGTSTLKRETINFHYPNYSNMGNRLAGALRAGKWKLIEFFGEDAMERYDLKEAIGEQHNLVSQRPDKAAALRRKLHQWQSGVDGLMPRPR